MLSDFSPVGNSVVGKETSGISALPKPWSYWDEAGPGLKGLEKV